MPHTPAPAQTGQNTQKGLDVASQLQALRTKNLAFFQERYPNIHKAFVNYRLSDIKLNIDGETGEVDIIVDGKLLYNGEPRQYARREIETFKQTFSEGKLFDTVSHPRNNTYSQPRFFHQRANATVNKSPAKDILYRGYELEDFYPLVVFFGIGAGYHIETFLLENDVQHVIIVEADLDYFAASLYTVDWARLHEGCSPKSGRSIDLLIGNLKDSHNIFALTWNNLLHFCPLFPASTFMYNHRANPVYAAPIDKICTDLHVFLGLFGYYDDEINQLNNALHNFHKKIPCLPPRQLTRQFKPVCVVGAGPSLDNRIDFLKKYRDQITIISCGTSLRSLYYHGIKPDFHVEVESHYATVLHLQNLAPAEWVRDIPFIGAAQVNPYAFALFNNKRIYFKGESSVARLFGNDEQNIANGTPTCTNAATAIASHHGCQQIYFFGMDFGYHDRAKHHATGSIYLDQAAPDLFQGGNKAYQEAKMFEVAAANGGTIKTTAIFYHCKRRIEHLIMNNPGIQYFNCSDGVEIEKSTHIAVEDMEAMFTNQTNVAQENLADYLFSKSGKPVNTKSVYKHTGEIKASLKYLQDMVATELNRLEPTLKNLSLVVFRINYIIEHEFTKYFPDCYYFIRGSIWHFLFLGFSHAFVLKDQTQRQAFILTWAADFNSLLADIQTHFSGIVDKNYKDHKKDAWLKVSLDHPEPK